MCLCVRVCVCVRACDQPQTEKQTDREEDRQEYGEADRKAHRGEETDDDEDERLQPSGWYFCSFVILWRRRRTRPRHHHNHHHRTRGERETFLSRNREIVWSSRAYFLEEGRLSSSSAAAQSTVPPGPTMYAMSHAVDQASTFHLFITPTVENIVLKMTNWEGRLMERDGRDRPARLHRAADLSGRVQGPGEAASSLWDTESGRAKFRATMPLKLFHTYSRLLRFDDAETRRRRPAMDKLAARWPLVIFHNIIDVSAYNAFVMWREIHPDWMLGKRNKRRVFLQELGRALVTPFIAQRERTPHTEASTAAALRQLYPGGARPKRPSSIAPAAAAPLRVSKRKRCQMCPRKNSDRGCNKYICKGCSLVYCNMCA